MSQRSSGSELNDIESALAGLVPVASRLDRDRLMFDAGAASARSASRGRWVWPSIAAALTAALVSESLVLAIRPGPRVTERIVVVREPVPAARAIDMSDVPVPHDAPAGLSGDGRSSETSYVASSWSFTPEYRRTPDLLLRFGLDALPEHLSPLLSRSDGPVDSMVVPDESAGQLRRLELEKLLNPNPGGPS